ncbi:GRF zinc finger containing protein [Striga asiatica]|uniref:GRF zinc finger containing protein n=1 Tax=Striga asiatica TaxID=4170 RepID=A0A5A7PMH1_STRAF|nr:GRF zinc finger containing protein [Striga asiatica]
MSASSSSNSRIFKLECGCGDEPGLFTSNTYLNPCRRFRRCINTEQLKCEKNTVVAMAERLKMKEDELLCLKSKANDLEEQLKCEENTAVAMAERLKMKENELLCLKSKVNDLEKQVQVLSKRNIFRNRIVCVSVVLFVVLLFSLGKGENVTLFNYTTML